MSNPARQSTYQSTSRKLQYATSLRAEKNHQSTAGTLPWKVGLPVLRRGQEQRPSFVLGSRYLLQAYLGVRPS